MKLDKVISLIKEGKIKTKEDLKKYCKSTPFSKLREYLDPKLREYLDSPLLIKKPTRCLSGVSVIAVMCKPHECPGNCIYCPKGENAPKSYTGKEPAAMRAINNNYDPFSQVKDRLNQYKILGHDTSKIEIIIMGGTFLSMPKDYQINFVSGIYKALNNSTTNDLQLLKKENETAKHRCVALTIETRPDFCKDEDIQSMLNYGATRVELGVQTIYDNILKKINRGHTIKETIDATKRLKENGFKVDYHIMIGLPGSSIERDIKMFKTLFSNENFMPDGLKIYPCLVIKGTKLYEEWKKGNYLPLTDEDAIRIISKVMNFVPPWVRIKRIMRDIPATEISAGPRRSNLRELAWKLSECNCIRCRETGRKRHAKEINLSIIKYRASGGDEYFISYEDFSTGALVGFLRLRLSKEAFVRELHVYGKTTPIGKTGEWQHKGIGTSLLKIAEEYAFSEGYPKLKVISGVGVREYYKKRGYSLESHYMVKYNK